MSTVVLHTAKLVARNKGVEYRLRLSLLKNIYIGTSLALCDPLNEPMDQLLEQAPRWLIFSLLWRLNAKSSEAHFFSCQTQYEGLCIASR
jgi:hypothetical protein